MNCEHFPLVAYIGKMLSSDEYQMAELHLQSCPECRKQVESMTPDLERMRLFWPRPDQCPGTWELTHFLLGEILNPDIKIRIEEHVRQCRFCAEICKSYELSLKSPADTIGNVDGFLPERFKEMLEEHRRKKSP